MEVNLTSSTKSTKRFFFLFAPRTNRWQNEVFQCGRFVGMPKKKNHTKQMKKTQKNKETSVI